MRVCRVYLHVDGCVHVCLGLCALWCDDAGDGKVCVCACVCVRVLLRVSMYVCVCVARCAHAFVHVLLLCV